MLSWLWQRLRGMVRRLPRTTYFREWQRAQLGIVSGTTGLLPVGAIVMWSGLVTAIPAGWALCNGNNGTPNLLGRFIKSVPNSTTNPGTSGGSSTHDHTGGSHTHDLVGTHVHRVVLTHTSVEVQAGTGVTVADDVNHDQDSANVTSGSTGAATASTTGSVNNEPLYFTLAFIMKIT